MLTVKPLEKFEMCFMSGNELQTRDTIDTHVTPVTQTHVTTLTHKHM